MPPTPDGTYVKHWLLAFGGSFFGSEQWQCTARFLSPVSRLDAEFWADAETFLPHAKTVTRAWFVGNTAGWSNAAKLEWIKFNPIGTNGRYLQSGPTIRDDWAPAETSPTASWAAHGYCPPDCALAVSWHTELRGPRGAHGRVYLPPQLPTINTSGKIDATALTAIATHAQTWANNINNSPGFDAGTGPRLAVVSPKSARYGTAPMNTEVTSVRVGSVMDTQRRRGKGLTEDYTALDITPA